MAKLAQPKPQKATGVITVGNVMLLRMNSGKLWLTHADGEGMECGPDTEKKLARTLERFFNKHF